MTIKVMHTPPLDTGTSETKREEIRRYFQRLRGDGTVRACYEASGAGYVLQRAFCDWGIECHLAAPSLIPRRPGEHRKTDRRDAIKLARDFRDDRLVTSTSRPRRTNAVEDPPASGTPSPAGSIRLSPGKSSVSRRSGPRPARPPPSSPRACRLQPRPGSGSRPAAPCVPRNRSTRASRSPARVPSA